MKWKLRLVLAMAIIAILGACKKTEEYPNNAYQCLCGSMNWQGQNIELMDANYIQIWPDSLFSRRYYATADLRNHPLELANSVNVTIEIEDITDGPFFPELGEAYVLVELVDLSAENSVREFAPVEGVVSVQPGLPGISEKVSYSFSLKEIINGELVGFPISISGDMSISY
jgi:hypothetical protein